MLKRAACVIIALCGLANAQQAPVSSSYMDFSGGLNNYTASIYLNKNESPRLMNVVIDGPLGELVQRNGYQTCGHTPSGNTATAMFQYTKDNGARYLIVSDNISIWQTDDCQTWTTVWTGLDANSIPHFAIVYDNLWAVNGSTYPVVWNGATGYQLDGANGRPLAPKAKYIAFWKGRVFLGNSAADPSGLYFSALTDTNGNVLDPATSTGAWANSNNLIYFNRDDGSPLYGIKVYRDNLYGFKETGILRLVFESQYQMSVSKTVSVTGSKFQDSIVEMDDGYLRFVGKDGFYRFNGNNVQRISTKWTPTFYTMLQPSMNQAYQQWDSALDFAAGTLTNLATGVQGYTNKLSLPVVDMSNWSYETGTTGWTLSGTATRAAYASNDIGGIAYGTALRDAIAGGSYLVAMDNDSPSTGRAGATFSIQDINGNTLDSKQVYVDGAGSDTGVVRISLSCANHVGPVRLAVNEYWNTGAIHSSYFPAETMPDLKVPLAYQISIQRISHMDGGKLVVDHQYNKVHFDLSTLSTETPKVFSPLSGTWESQDIQSPGLTAWRLFDTVDNSNGQTLTYQIKTADTQAHLATASYSNITPGVVVSAGTNTWSKVKVTLASALNYWTPYSDRITENWITGNLSKSGIVSTNYSSRYWTSVSTDQTKPYNNISMVESRSPLATYTMFDLPITAMTVWNDKLYGAIGGTDKIALMDTGSTDDGATIHSYWDSRDEIYTSPVIYKSVNKMIVDYRRQPVNPGLQIGLSNDLGNTFSYKTLDTGAVALPRNTKIINMDANRTLQFRSRIKNDTSGVGFDIIGVHTFGSEGNFLGN